MSEHTDNARKALQQACAGLYQQFAAYGLKPHVDGCPCCVSDAHEARLHVRPLRELGPAELERFARKAMTTWGDEDDFRHFLPRLFELAPTGYGGGGANVDVEILYGKLSYGKWRSWPQAEQRAVERYLAAVWEHALASHAPDRYPESDTYLCAIAQAVDDLRPYLTHWQTLHTYGALDNLSGFIETRFGELIEKGRPDHAFWGNRPEQARQVGDWLLDPATAEAYEEAFARLYETPNADALAAVVDALRQLQSYR